MLSRSALAVAFGPSSRIVSIASPLDLAHAAVTVLLLLLAYLLVALILTLSKPTNFLSLARFQRRYYYPKRFRNGFTSPRVIVFRSISGRRAYGQQNFPGSVIGCKFPHHHCVRVCVCLGVARHTITQAKKSATIAQREVVDRPQYLLHHWVRV